MTAATWAGVHVGDVVRGADQRGWRVVERRERNAFVVAGERAWFRLSLGERETTIERQLAEPVDLIERADHSETASAFSALIGAQLAPRLIGETTVTVADPLTVSAVRRDRFGRYMLPDPTTGADRPWTRVTTVARTLADEYHLNQWKLRMVCKGIAQRPDLIAGAAAADPDADKSRLNDIAQQAMDRAGAGAGANLGTALHSFAQRLDMGELISSLGAPDPLGADLAAYADALKANRLAIYPEYVERVVVLPELGIAGTFDRIVGQQPGVTKAAPLAVLDLKTGKDLSYAWLEIAIQQALYVHASLMWNPETGSYEPMPVGVDRDRALVLHLPVGKAHGQLYGVNIIEGWEFAQLALSVRAARNQGKGLAWLVEPEPIDLALHNVSRAMSKLDLAQLWESLHPRGLWTDEVNAAAQARLAAITATA